MKNLLLIAIALLTVKASAQESVKRIVCWEEQAEAYSVMLEVDRYQNGVLNGEMLANSIFEKGLKFAFDKEEESATQLTYSGHTTEGEESRVELRIYEGGRAQFDVGHEVISGSTLSCTLE